MELLPHLQIQEIHATARDLGLDRHALLNGIPPSFAGTLATSGAPAPQMFTDLSLMNGVPALDDGSVPLRRWLENALLLSGARTEGEVFRRALARL